MTSAPIVVTVSDTGVVTHLVSDDARAFMTSASVMRRASHVQPVNPVLRWVFIKLRDRFGDYGKMSKFTRLWPCAWMVDCSPVGGPILPGQWLHRDHAIAAEIDWLQTNFLLH